jgi:hypothetical protein
MRRWFQLLGSYLLSLLLHEARKALGGCRHRPQLLLLQQKLVQLEDLLHLHWVSQVRRD